MIHSDEVGALSRLAVTETAAIDVWGKATEWEVSLTNPVLWHVWYPCEDSSGGELVMP